MTDITRQAGCRAAPLPRPAAPAGGGAPGAARPARRRGTVLLGLLLGALLALTLAACGDDDGGTDAAGDAPATARDDAPVRDPFDGGYPRFEDAAAGLSAILGTPDLGVGTQRVSFVLTGADGIVRLPVAAVRTFFRPDGPTGPREGPVAEATAHFAEFPLGTRGLYVTNLDFDRAGTWTVEASVPTAAGGRATIDLTFPVAERPHSPAVGDPAPASVQRTLADVDDVHELSTGAEPDAEVYRQTIADVLAAGRPFVVVFASPGFCTNALCGPQVEMLTPLRERYGDRMDFIHVDLYENPTELRSDFDLARRTPVLDEWGLDTDEWTFVVGPDGRIAARFEAFTPEPEVTAAIEALLGAS